MNDLLAAQYAIALENPEPCNYSRIPNILDHLTYDSVDEKTGEIKIKRISIYAKELYRVFKSVSGQSNICWMNTENLAELANMSKSSVSECKKELQQKFHQLDGNSLIEITEKNKVTKKGDEKINGTTFHQITIKNIWGFNRAFFLLKRLEKERAGSPCERAEGQVRHANAPSQGAGSPCELNKIQDKKNLFKEQQYTAGADPVCLSDNENVVVEDKKLAWFNFLLKIGFDTLAATGIISAYDIEDIRQACLYTEKQKEINKKKGKSMPNILGYIRKVLENRWWIPKPI